jgi:hypothetical protein
MPQKQAISLTATLLILATVAGCKPSTPPEANQQQAADAPEATAAPVASPVDGTSASRQVAAAYQGDSNFSGPALDTIKQHGTPAGQALSPAVATTATSSAKLEECTYVANPSDSYLIDLDGDGKREGISFYTLTQCKVGQDLRVMVLFRQDQSGKWSSVLETAITVGQAPPRPILAIDQEAGTISIQTTADNLGGPPPAPEVIEVPLADDPITQTNGK